MAHDGLDEGLIDRLREKYANMSKTANNSAGANGEVRKGSIAANELDIAQDSPPASDAVPGTSVSSCRAGICGVCNGSGERLYEYNFRQMTEQCKQCDGDGILNCQKEVPSSDTAARRSGTFIPGSQRIMTEQQRDRVKVLRSQVAKLEHKVSTLEDERLGLTQQVIHSPDQQALNEDLIQALDNALSSLHSAKQSRQDRLSYYDGMVEPGTQSTPGEGSDHVSIETRSSASSTGTAIMDSS